MDKAKLRKGEHDPYYVNCGDYHLGRKGKWCKLVDYALSHSNESFTKKEIMYLSGYTDDWTKERKEWFKNADNKDLKGQNSCLFSALNHWNYLEYDKHTRRWHIGSRFN